MCPLPARAALRLWAHKGCEGSFQLNSLRQICQGANKSLPVAIWDAAHVEA